MPCTPIQEDMVKQVEFFNEIGKHLEAKRLEERVNYDLEMMRELGYCSGIENYSRYFDRRHRAAPFCLLDYFPEDFLMVIDESHVTVSQVSAMYGGDRSRKKNLVEYGFRLPSAMDNRPLKFEEFDSMIGPDHLRERHPGGLRTGTQRRRGGGAGGAPHRPAGPAHRSAPQQGPDRRPAVRDPRARAQKEERVLVTTLTKRMAEELTISSGRTA
jgi:excinuclease ABC subunit B